MLKLHLSIVMRLFRSCVFLFSPGDYFGNVTIINVALTFTLVFQYDTVKPLNKALFHLDCTLMKGTFLRPQWGSVNLISTQTWVWSLRLESETKGLIKAWSWSRSLLTISKHEAKAQVLPSYYKYPFWMAKASFVVRNLRHMCTFSALAPGRSELDFRILLDGLISKILV